jgi:hypothetical protein
VKRKHGYEMKIVELYMGIYFYEDIGYGIVLRKKLKILYGIQKEKIIVNIYVSYIISIRIRCS